uniref:Uncharacterized protein MANES_06G012600 n=1 Tax=Rhizophora mucronata TaxID=61149 RepID=A0A2P2KHU8_RHIMU
MVRVPVLSNTMVFTMENFSKIFPPRKSNPLVAPNEVPTSTAVGVAKPSAQGQATTKTLQESCRASETGFAWCKVAGSICAPKKFQKVNVATESAITP